jgi:hypothetical protein
VFTIRTFIPLLALALVACTPDAYQRSADRQVYRMLEDRKKGVLDYEPDTTLDDTAPAEHNPARSAFDKFPVTVLPDDAPAAILPPQRRLPYESLGPDPEDILVPPSPDLTDVYGIEAELRREAESFQYGPPAPLDPQQRLDLFGALRYAARHSRTYQTRVEDVYLAALDVTLERHLFEPRFFARTGVEYRAGRDTNEDAEFESALAVTNSVGVRQQLPYGGEVVAQALVDFVDTLRGEAESGENAALVLSGSIPLLRGAGWVNLEPLIQSERELVYQIRDFESFRRELLVQITSSYFNVLTSQRRLANRRLNYLNTLQLTARSQALFEAGRLNFSQVQRAQQSLLRAEALVVSEQGSYRTRLDQFKLLLGMPVDQPLEVIPVEVQVKLPQTPPEEVVELASRFRLDLQTARDRVEDAQRFVEVAENGLLPDVNLRGEARVSNLDNSPAFDIEGRSARYAAGIEVDLPIDHLDERNTYRRSLIGLQRAQRNYELLRDQIGIDARDALRTIATAELQLRIAESRIRLAQRQLDYANELLKEGRADTRDVVEAQSSLLEAQDSYDSSQAQLRISVLEYLRETGTLRLDPETNILGQALAR